MAPPVPISPAEPARPAPESGLGGAGGLDSESDPPPAGALASPLTATEPGPLPVGGPGSDIAEGGPAEAGCEEEAEPTKDLVAALAYRLAAEINAETVFPTSPRTILLAMKGISAIAIENRMLTAPNRTIWLDPTNALRTPFPPSTAFTLFICKAVIRTCKIAYSKPQL